MCKDCATSPQINGHNQLRGRRSRGCVGMQCGRPQMLLEHYNTTGTKPMYNVASTSNATAPLQQQHRCQPGPLEGMMAACRFWLTRHVCHATQYRRLSPHRLCFASAYSTQHDAAGQQGVWNTCWFVASKQQRRLLVDMSAPPLGCASKCTLPEHSCKCCVRSIVARATAREQPRCYAWWIGLITDLAVLKELAA